jgi:hypothetical protein
MVEIVRDDIEELISVIATVNIENYIHYNDIFEVLELLKTISKDRVSDKLFEGFDGIELTRYRMRLNSASPAIKKR